MRIFKKYLLVFFISIIILMPSIGLSLLHFYWVGNKIHNKDGVYVLSTGEYDDPKIIAIITLTKGGDFYFARVRNNEGEDLWKEDNLKGKYSINKNTITFLSPLSEGRSITGHCNMHIACNAFDIYQFKKEHLRFYRLNYRRGLNVNMT